MSKLFIRHALSEANNREKYGTPVFGNPAAGLMPKGEEQALALGVRLVTEYNVDVAHETAAVSMMRRSRDTAIAAGFMRLHLYPELNEKKGGLNDEEIRLAINNKQPPEATIIAAQYLIEHPPEEFVVIAHALVIATMCLQLQIYQNARFIPKHCEVRELPL